MKLSHTMFLLFVCASIVPVTNASRPASPSLNAASSSSQAAVPSCDVPLITHNKIMRKLEITRALKATLESTMARRFGIAKQIKKLVPAATPEELQFFTIDEITDTVLQKERELGDPNISETQRRIDFGSQGGSILYDMREQIYRDRENYEAGKLNEQCKMK